MIVLLVDRDGELAAGDREGYAQDRVRRLGEGRVVVVRADGLRLADVGDVDDPHSRMPDRGPELVLVAQGVMQPVFVTLDRKSTRLNSSHT